MSDAEQFYEVIALIANALPPMTCLIVGCTHCLIYHAGSKGGYDNTISSTARQEHSHTSCPETAPQTNTKISPEEEFAL